MHRPHLTIVVDTRDSKFTSYMATKKYFTSAELRLLNTSSNAHVAYQGKVYDVSSFISHHPGGSEQILAGAGRDITQLFKSYHSEVTFDRVLSKYYVGELVDSALPTYIANESAFYTTLKQRVNKYMRKHHLDSKLDTSMFIHYIIVICLYLSSMYTVLTYHQSFIIFILATMLWANSTTNVAHTLYHDASHFSITHKPIVWRVLSIVAACITGVSTLNWKYSHVLGHHIYTNVDGADPDINTAKESDKAVWRIKKSQSWRSKFLFQHLYMPILYCLLFIKLRFQDFRFAIILMKDCVPMNPLSISQWMQFIFEKLTHSIVRYIIPYSVLPLGHFILMIVLFEVVSSLLLAQISLLNHVTDKVAWPLPDQDNKIHEDWAKLQVMSTYDYCTDNIFVTLYTGSMNHQTAHHLFPGYLQSHYRWITPIIRRTCAEFGIQYHCMDSVLDMLRLHYGYLKFMGSSRHLGEETDKR